MVRLVALDVPSPADAWARLGFGVVDDVVVVGGIALHVGGDGNGIVGWAFDEAVPATVDGLATRTNAAVGAGVRHPNGIDAVDHVVVGTGDVVRTLAALESIGLASRRQRIGDLRGATVHQEFVVAGTCVIELVGPVEADGGPATFWGLAFASPDLDATAAVMGDRLRAPRDAIQPGRRIATVRGGRTSTGVPLAVLSART